MKKIIEKASFATPVPGGVGPNDSCNVVKKYNHCHITWNSNWKTIIKNH